MSRRIQIVLPDPAADQLGEQAAAAGMPPSTLAAQLVREQLQSQTPEPIRGPERPRRDRLRRPPWLEPYGDRRRWRSETWGAIVALHARYPRLLAGLKDDWWQDAAHLETLCALAAWRAQIDIAGESPREELAFQDRLDDYARALNQQGGGVTKAWVPGAPPSEWAAPSSR